MGPVKVFWPSGRIPTAVRQPFDGIYDMTGPGPNGPHARHPVGTA